jgi:uncharacterized delta-60 repeat protein
MKAPLFLVFFVSCSLSAQTVSVDNSFGVNGIVVVPTTSEIHKTVITPDGEIISAGYSIESNGSGAYHLTLTKHHADGSINDDFGTNGIAEHHINFASQPFDMVLLDDGKILVAGFVYLGPTQSGPGETQAFVSRCKPNGELDSTFAADGTFTLNVSDGHFTNLFVEDDNSILLSGNVFNGAILYKLDSDGTPVASFGTNGMKQLSEAGSFFINFSAIKLQDGNLLSVGLDGTEFDNTKLACQKLDAAGNRIPGFGENGRFIYDSYSGLPEITELFSHAAERSDGKIVLSGSVLQRTLALLNPDGTLDNTFGTGGFLLHDYPNSHLILQEDNKILLGGNVEIWDYNYGISITRFTDNGDPDPSFNFSGNYELDISEENDYLQTFQFTDETHLLIGGSSRLNNGNADFLLAKLDISETLSLEETAESDFSIYPNPAKNVLFFEGILPEKVSILSAQGQILIETDYSNENGIDLNDLASGSYLVTFENKLGSYSKAFVKF